MIYVIILFYIPEIVQQKLAFKQLKAEKEHLNEENESQARSKSNMKLK